MSEQDRRPRDGSPRIWDELRLAGELHTDEVTRKLYSTDASEFQEMPSAVAMPRTEEDVRHLILFAARHRIGLIPRTAGTSLAGQVVGSGIVVDVGRHMRQIVAIEPQQRQARVQPGVIRNELNQELQSYGLFFAPETSTANRAMIGGMIGNNSCGANSVVYGATREHLISARGFLSDGSEAFFGPLSPEEFQAKCQAADSLETRIYRKLRDILSDPIHRQAVAEGFPHPSVSRRNTGYALDRLLASRVFDPACDQPFNLCKLIAGSEGTLFFGVEFVLDCDPLPPSATVMCVHFASIAEALQANLIALRHGPSACELIDKHILDCARKNIAQSENRFFVQGDPGAILVVEIRRASREASETVMRAIESELRAAGLGYAYPVLRGADVQKVWELRRSGQAVMTNVVGDERPAEVVEDTAVAVADLPSYIAEFDALMRGKFGIHCVYYGHAASGELHTRPMLNLKTPEGHAMFRAVAQDVAALVKKYRGSLSGEHGDGRLRGEFIRFMVGDACYSLMREVKNLFDPLGILNPGKIIDAPPMDTFLRYESGHPTPDYETLFDFSDLLGVLRAAEKCNGAADCRKTLNAGGAMCPSYMATCEEKDTPRARANILRHALTAPDDPSRPFANREVREVMDLCLSCKACKAECPSNVDITKLKAEFLQQFYDAFGVPWRTRLIASFSDMTRWFAPVWWMWNAIFGTPALRRLAHRVVGFHPDRTVPLLARQTLRSWLERRPVCQRKTGRKVFLFCDEFTNSTETELGIATVELLERLGYEVMAIPHPESGRAALSKGLLRRARKLASDNVRRFERDVGPDRPLLGIEPSAILSFRDEYPDLLRAEEQAAARRLAQHCFMVEEFLVRELDAGRLDTGAFRSLGKVVHLHGHCHQKALSSVQPVVRLLERLAGCSVRVIPSGCCGMAGSFGYESEHFKVANAIGELVLFPYVRRVPPGEIVAASGTSCRHQIHDGTQRKAMHPIQILRSALH
jgi:FAD/FMN-containing dehydrogenase/Fe-S oxidoreductase